MTDRSTGLEDVAARLVATELGRPVRVAIDGITASGKSTVAAALASSIRQLGRPAIHLTMDGFHHRRAHRHRQGRLSAEGYYWDAYDFESLISEVLVPLGPGGSGWYKEGVIDLASDEALTTAAIEAPRNAILVVDGTFLQRSPIVEHWDRTVFVDTDFAVAQARGIERDSALLGGRDKAAEAFQLRYHAASRLYVDDVDPRSLATFVVDNNP